MYITPIGLVLIPPSLAIFFFRPDYLGPWAIIVSAFQAASVLNIEGGFPIGVTPYFFVLILIALRFVPLWLGGKCSFRRSDVAIGMTQPLLILTIWAFVSAFLLPWLFAGVGVNTPRAGMDSPQTTPLQLNMSNTAQAVYAVLNTIFVIYLLWCGRRRGYFERLIWAFVGAGLIAALIGAYQYVAHYSGLPYPVDFFNSNPGWRQLISQRFSGVWRVSATFSEPSAAGAFFAVWSTLLLFIASDDRGGRGLAWPLFVAGMIMVFLTTSTTGYVIAALVIASFVWKEFSRVFTTGRISTRGMFSLLLLAGAIAAAAVLIPNLRELATKIIWHKTESQSSRDRAATIWEALRITSETYGMGVGLGSNRPSGMLFYIASNLGIPGLLVFTWMIWAIYRTLGSALRSKLTSDRAAAYLGAVGWATAIELVAMASAGGDMMGPLLWVCLGVTAAGSRAVWLRRQDGPEVIELPESCRIRTVTPLIILREEYCIS
jgi:hypothetical protein